METLPGVHARLFDLQQTDAKVDACKFPVAMYTIQSSHQELKYHLLSENPGYLWGVFGQQGTI